MKKVVIFLFFVFCFVSYVKAEEYSQVCANHILVPTEMDAIKIKSQIKNFEDFKSKNIGTYYYLTRYGKKPHTSFDYSNKDENIYLIFGKESTGIPKEILKNDLEHCMRIPMTDKVRALNVSNSVAIMVYEVLRQQDYNDLLRCEPFKGEDYLEK